MESIDEMLETLRGIELTFDEIAPIIEFLESLREHVVFCKECEKVRLDPGMEMKINGKVVPMCEPCLDEFLGKMAPHASEVEYELEGGTKITTQPGSNLMTLHGPDQADPEE